MRLTIKAKLIGGFATVVLLSCAMGAIACRKLEEMAVAQQEMALWTKRVNAVMDVSEDLRNSARPEKNALLVASDADVERFAARAVEYRKSATKRSEDLLAIAGEEGARRLVEIARKGDHASVLQAEILRLARLDPRSRASAVWENETIPAIGDVAVATNAVIARASGPDAPPEMLRAALALQEARLEWLRVSRSAALALGMSTADQVEKRREEVEEEAKVVLAKLMTAAEALAEQGVATEAMTTAFRNGLASVVRTVGTAAGTAAETAAPDAAVGAASARSLLLAIIAATLLIALGAAAWIAAGLSRGLRGTLGIADAVARGDPSPSRQPRSDDAIGAPPGETVKAARQAGGMLSRLAPAMAAGARIRPAATAVRGFAFDLKEGEDVKHAAFNRA